ncbi:orotidine-5'-phosphate decarboxylase [Subtercola boreus]|uniref:Orotidine-5'-phosphate decarboxylase n=1 Tax=Subtercola boreus TaxID=120213 RepID=A0A3E0WBC8_9MICO|nr:orotidine-5'-phosphate decarboxylase [Subtercola boreus]RFA21757.1 orotidine-5'-phosphate decarboxylase [Subtercola boreus]RFA27729.1 orotidine-5'-phosphate decarboxylase [Subtercola boreus]
MTPGVGGAGGFGSRLAAVFAASGQLCVGIDPHDYLLDAWGLDRSADGVREFGLRVVDAAAGRVGILKPQVAFYELYGAAGFAALEQVLTAARSAGLIVIADAKRGDIGTSAEAYGRAWLEPGSPLEADAVTLTAYAGVGSLMPVFALVEKIGKGAFVLSATSNPESFSVQSARADREGESLSLAGLVAADVGAHNRAHHPDTSAVGNIGLVLGATKTLTDYGIDRDRLAATPATPVLAPGFGFQGATFADVRRVYGTLTPTTVVAVSRSVLQAGPAGLASRIDAQVSELRDALGAADAPSVVGALGAANEAVAGSSAVSA